MIVPQLYSCCGCFSLRTGLIIIALLGMYCSMGFYTLICPVDDKGLSNRIYGYQYAVLIECFLNGVVAVVLLGAVWKMEIACLVPFVALAMAEFIAIAIILFLLYIWMPPSIWNEDLLRELTEMYGVDHVKCCFFIGMSVFVFYKVYGCWVIKCYYDELQQDVIEIIAIDEPAVVICTCSAQKKGESVGEEKLVA